MYKLLIILEFIFLTLNWQPTLAMLKGDKLIGNYYNQLYFDSGKEIYVANLWDVNPWN